MSKYQTLRRVPSSSIANHSPSDSNHAVDGGAQIVARNLRLHRQACQLTQEELAHQAGLYRNYIGMIEREKNSPTIDTLDKLARVLKIDPMEFLRRDIV